MTAGKLYKYIRDRIYFPENTVFLLLDIEKIDFQKNYYSCKILLKTTLLKELFFEMKMLFNNRKNFCFCEF